MDTRERIRTLRRWSYACQFPKGRGVCGKPAPHAEEVGGEAIALCEFHRNAL